MLEYSLEKGKSACPGEYITFTCIVRGSSILSWSSDEYIGGEPLQFTTDEEPGLTKNISNSDTYATLISVVKGSDASLECELHIQSYQSSPVSCSAGNDESRQSINFTVLGDGTCKYTLAD